MDIKRGIPVSGGVAIGPALVLDSEWYRIPQRDVEPARAEAEVERLHQALRAAGTDMAPGCATQAGGRAAHTAIMAGALEIPAAAGLNAFVTDVAGGDLVIVDGNRGLLILDADPETLARYETARTSYYQTVE